MSNVEEFPVSARRLTEYEALVAAAPTTLDAIPGGVYVCDQDGRIVRFNTQAEELWGRAPSVGEPGINFAALTAYFSSTAHPLRMTNAPWRRR